MVFRATLPRALLRARELSLWAKLRRAPLDRLQAKRFQREDSFRVLELDALETTPEITISCFKSRYADAREFRRLTIQSVSHADKEPIKVAYRSHAI